ncbi:hypothetical protein ACEV9L_10735 [Vibrio parahaemolyticus]
MSHPPKFRLDNCYIDERMKAKMVAGILALSTISNGISSKESTKPIANNLADLKQKHRQQTQDNLP